MSQHRILKINQDNLEQVRKDWIKILQELYNYRCDDILLKNSSFSKKYKTLFGDCSKMKCEFCNNNINLNNFIILFYNRNSSYYKNKNILRKFLEIYLDSEECLNLFILKSL